MEHLNFLSNIHWLLEHCLGNTSLDSILASNRKIHQKFRVEKLAGLSPGKQLAIPSFDSLTDRELIQQYIRCSEPVIIQGGAKQWGCIGKWTPEWLAENYGEDPVTLIDASPDNLKDITYRPELTNLKRVIAGIKEGDTSKYSRFNRLLYDHPELLADIESKWLMDKRHLFSSGSTYQVFIGGAGSKTHLHSAAEHNLFVQVYGKKTWYLYRPQADAALRPPVKRNPYFHSEFDPENPDYQAYPEMYSVDRYECTLNPGDILFNPPSFWHHVMNPTDSIGVGFRWFEPYACFKTDFMQTLLTLLATKPFIWTATKHRTDFPKIFETMNK